MNNDLFEKTPVPKAIATLAIPTILGMLVNVVYNMADTFFVGQTQDPNQVAAVTLTMPIFLLFMAIGNIFGIGGGAYISRLLGEQRQEDAKHVSAFSFYGSLFFGALFAGILLLFMHQILPWVGTSANTYDFAKDYLTIIAYGAPFVCLSTTCSQIVRSEGAARSAMAGMIIGTIANIILDPIMILNMDMGVKGAAFATIIGNILSVLFYWGYFLKSRTILSIFPKAFTLRADIAKNVVVIGVPVSVNNLLMSCSNIILNNFAVNYNDNVIAAIGIVSKINMLTVMVLIGLSQGLQPFVGYNYGAKNYKRMTDSIKFSMLVGVLIGTTFMILSFIFADQVVRIFIKDEEVLTYGRSFLKVVMSVGPALGIQFIIMTTFQALGKALPALILSLCRQGIIFIPALFIFDKFFGLYGIIWAQPFADFAAIFIAILLFIHTYKKIKHSMA